MRFILLILLFVIFGYSLGLVLVNGSEVAVNLLFTQAPAMNLGLLLILCMFLGVVIGMLLALLLFKVLQNKWEIGRLNKENKKLQEQLKEANITIDRQAHAQHMPNTQSVDQVSATSTTGTINTTDTVEPTKTTVIK